MLTSDLKWWYNKTVGSKSEGIILSNKLKKQSLEISRVRLWLNPQSADTPAFSLGTFVRRCVMKSYCTQNDGDCSTCSLVNYGRDCQNNPIDDETAHEVAL